MAKKPFLGIPKGEAEQVSNIGVVRTNDFRSFVESINTSNSDDTRYHLPFHGKTTRK